MALWFSTHRHRWLTFARGHALSFALRRRLCPASRRGGCRRWLVWWLLRLEERIARGGEVRQRHGAAAEGRVVRRNCGCAKGLRSQPGRWVKRFTTLTTTGGTRAARGTDPIAGSTEKLLARRPLGAYGVLWQQANAAERRRPILSCRSCVVRRRCCEAEGFVEQQWHQWWAPA